MTDRFTPTPEQLAEIVAKHQLWLDDAEGSERANLEGANLEGANLEGANLYGAYLEGANLYGAYLEDCQMNWQSHDLIAERLRQAAGKDAYKTLAAGYILMNRRWCWHKLLKKVPAQISDLLPWVLEQMRSWVKDGDGAPEILTQAAPVAVEEVTS